MNGGKETIVCPSLERVKYNISLLEKDYSIFESRTQQYFTYLYNTIHFTMVYYGGILVLLNAFPGTDPGKRETFSLIAFYALPIITYVLGLIYVYNLSVLYRIGEEQIKIEKRIMALAVSININDAISNWNQKAKEKTPGTGFLLPYGTMLMFYILVPLGIILAFDFMIDWTKDLFFWIVQFSIPIGVWLVFLAFMIILICKMKNTQDRIDEFIAD